jgi:hypothetical protein
LVLGVAVASQTELKIAELVAEVDLVEAMGKVVTVFIKLSVAKAVMVTAVIGNTEEPEELTVEEAEELLPYVQVLTLEQ